MTAATLAAAPSFEVLRGFSERVSVLRVPLCHEQWLRNILATCYVQHLGHRRDERAGTFSVDVETSKVELLKATAAGRHVEQIRGRTRLEVTGTAKRTPRVDERIYRRGAGPR